MDCAPCTLVKSDIDLSVALTDQSSSASSGPAHVVINGSGSDGNDKVDGAATT